MTPRQIYNLALDEKNPTSDAFSLCGCYYNHVDECKNPLEYGADYSLVQVNNVKFHCYDGRRVWRLATVWFENLPVMIIQNAGREGDDHYRRFITDEARFHEMIKYLDEMTLKFLNETHGGQKLADVVDMDEERDDLVNFYDQRLSGPFEYW